MRKFLLYLSAFIPLYFLIIVKLVIEIINNNLTFNVLNTLTLIILTTAIIVGSIGAFNIIKHSNTSSTTINIIEKTQLTEKYFLGYFSLFVLFALSFELERVSMFIVFIIIIVLIGIVYIRNDLFYINPFLNILGYNFYEITYTDQEGKKQSAKFLIKGKLDNTTSKHLAKLRHENFSMIIKE